MKLADEQASKLGAAYKELNGVLESILAEQGDTDNASTVFAGRILAGMVLLLATDSAEQLRQIFEFMQPHIEAVNRQARLHKTVSGNNAN